MSITENKMSDITGADEVEILIKSNSKVIWINTEKGCMLRICRIKKLIVNDLRIKQG